MAITKICVVSISSRDQPKEVYEVFLTNMKNEREIKIYLSIRGTIC